MRLPFYSNNVNVLFLDSVCVERHWSLQKHGESLSRRKDIIEEEIVPETGQLGCGI